MDGATVYYAKQKVKERQIPYDFTHMWNLRNKTDEHSGGEKTAREKGKPENRFLTAENKLRVAGGQVSWLVSGQGLG